MGGGWGRNRQYPFWDFPVGTHFGRLDPLSRDWDPLTRSPRPLMRGREPDVKLGVHTDTD
eukprot:scaffold6857_cov125-Isochrysis_galbana.AAC.10